MSSRLESIKNIHQNPKSGGRNWIKLLGVIAIIAILVIIYFGKWKNGESNSPQITNDSSINSPVPVSLKKDTIVLKTNDKTPHVKESSRNINIGDENKIEGIINTGDKNVINQNNSKVGGNQINISDANLEGAEIIGGSKYVIKKDSVK